MKDEGLIQSIEDVDETNEREEFGFNPKKTLDHAECA